MKTLSLKLLSTFATIALVTTTLISCAEKEAEDGDTDGGSTAVTITGNYRTNCFAIAGSANAGETHYRTVARYGYNGANTISFAKYFYSDSSCSTIVYGSSTSGTFTVGAATTTPANGYAITYNLDDVNIVVYGTSAGTAISGGCNTNVQWITSGNNKLGMVNGNFSCADLDIAGPNTPLYNVVTISGSTLAVGAPQGDNPGVTNVNAVANATSMTFTQY